MRLLVRVCLIVAGWVLCPGFVALGQLQVWRHMNTEGMFNSNIVCMTEDANGLLYLGTHGGVDIYDGRRFMHVEVPGLIEKGINPFVNQLRWGRKGILWVCTRTHIYTYDPSSGEVRIQYGNSSAPSVGNVEVDTQRNLLYFVDDDSLHLFSIEDTAIAARARIWTASVFKSGILGTGALYLLIDHREVVKLVNGKLEPVFADTGIMDMDVSANRDKIVVLCSKGLIEIDGATGKAERLPARNSWAFETGKTHLTCFSNGGLLVHHPQGIDLFGSHRDTSFTRFRSDERNPSSIREDFVICALMDRRGNIWISEDGINLSVLPANARHVSYVSDKKIGASRIWTSYHDSVHHQVFTSSELGICRLRYNSDTPSITTAIKPGGMKFFEPMAFQPWYRDELLVLTNGQGPWLMHTETLKFRPFDTLVQYGHSQHSYGIRALTPGKYAIFGRRGMYIFDRARGTFYEPPPDSVAGKGSLRTANVLSLAVDSRRQIWAADGGSLLVLDSSLRKLKTYEGKSQANPSGLANTVILDIKQARDGDIYLTTMGSGLMRLTAADTFEVVKLAGDITSVFCIAQPDSTHLLITSGKGLILYDISNRTSKVINEGYGMPVADFNQFALALDDQLVAASGTRGFVVINRAGLMAAFRDTARLLVLDGMQPQRDIVLNRGEETIELDVSVPEYFAGANWSIRYKLEGLDAEWRSLGKGEWKIRYNSIAPGEYMLRVEALDAQNVIYAAPIAIPVVALPYFWQTIWFRMLMVALAIAILIVTVRFFSQLQLRWKLKKMEDEQKISRERIRISRELHDNVGSQLTYLISGLESSNILLQKQETEKLELKIGRMQSSARESMQQLRDSIWALNSERVAASVLISRFGTWLDNIMEACPGTRHVIHSEIVADHAFDPIRSLNLFRIMQEAVHNVVKHAGASELKIAYKCTADALAIQIEDNGAGFDMGEVKGNGRKTMADRADEMGARFSMVSIEGEGTKISIYMALK